MIRVPYESETNPKLLDLLQKMLTKDPSQRITMDQMRVHPWVTNDSSDPLISVDENCQLVVTEVTDEEFSNAIKSVANIFTVVSLFGTECSAYIT
jgi:serine/threonine protein kinase